MTPEQLDELVVMFGLSGSTAEGVRHLFSTFAEALDRVDPAKWHPRRLPLGKFKASTFEQCSPYGERISKPAGVDWLFTSVLKGKGCAQLTVSGRYWFGLGVTSEVYGFSADAGTVPKQLERPEDETLAANATALSRHAATVEFFREAAELLAFGVEASTRSHWSQVAA